MALRALYLEYVGSPGLGRSAATIFRFRTSELGNEAGRNIDQDQGCQRSDSYHITRLTISLLCEHLQLLSGSLTAVLLSQRYLGHCGHSNKMHQISRTISIMKSAMISSRTQIQAKRSKAFIAQSISTYYCPSILSLSIYSLRFCHRTSSGAHIKP